MAPPSGPGKFWQQYLPVLRELAGQGWTDQQIFESGLIPVKSLSQITNTRHRYGIPAGEKARGRHHAIPTLTRVVSETPERIVYAPEETDAEPIEELWERAAKRTAREVARAHTEGVALVRLMTDKPVAISISSDWHVSTSSACDLAGLRAYAEAIRDTPGAYAIAVGDLADNAIKWTKQMRDIPDEWRLVSHLLTTFGLKMLGITSGNHDDWTKAFAGIDALRWIAEKGRIHFAPDELVYIIELVDPASQETTARYVVATRHRYYRHSNLNPTHACFRWLEDRVGQWPKAEDGGTLIPDILAIGHNHVACVEERTMPNGPIWGARMGAWQVTSTHGRAGGWRRSPATAPTFILYPHRSKPVIGFADYRQALSFLAVERQVKAA